MNQFAAKTILAASLLGIAGLGQANTAVNFAPLTSYYDGTAGDGATYLEGGLTFTSPAGGLKNWGTWRDWNADPLGAVLYDQLRISRDDCENGRRHLQTDLIRLG